MIGPVVGTKEGFFAIADDFGHTVFEQLGIGKVTIGDEIEWGDSTNGLYVLGQQDCFNHTTQETLDVFVQNHSVNRQALRDGFGI